MLFRSPYDPCVRVVRTGHPYVRGRTADKMTNQNSTSIFCGTAIIISKHNRQLVKLLQYILEGETGENCFARYPNDIFWADKVRTAYYWLDLAEPSRRGSNRMATSCIWPAAQDSTAVANKAALRLGFY